MTHALWYPWVMMKIEVGLLDPLGMILKSWGPQGYDPSTSRFVFGLKSMIWCGVDDVVVLESGMLIDGWDRIGTMERGIRRTSSVAGTNPRHLRPPTLRTRCGSEAGRHWQDDDPMDEIITDLLFWKYGTRYNTVKIVRLCQKHRTGEGIQ